MLIWNCWIFLLVSCVCFERD